MPADIGHNLGSHVEAYRETIARFKADAERFEEVTDANAQEMRDHIGYGGKLAKDIDGQRESEKKPHLEAGRQIDNAYKPLVSECDDIVKAMKRKLAAWMDAREREARAKAAEAARKLAEAEAAAAKAQAPEEEEDPFLAATAGAAEHDVKLAHAEAKTAEAEAMAASRVSSAAGGFKAAGLKTVRKAKITDLNALANHYISKNNVELTGLLEKLANADIRHAKGAAIQIPGLQIVEERVL